MPVCVSRGMEADVKRQRRLKGGRVKGVVQVEEIPRASATEIQRKLVEAMPRKQDSEGRSQNAAAKATIGRPVRAGSCRPIENVRLLCSLARKLSAFRDLSLDLPIVCGVFVVKSLFA